MPGPAARRWCRERTGNTARRQGRGAIGCRCGPSARASHELERCRGRGARYGDEPRRSAGRPGARPRPGRGVVRRVRRWPEAALGGGERRAGRAPPRARVRRRVRARAPGPGRRPARRRAWSAPLGRTRLGSSRTSCALGLSPWLRWRAPPGGRSRSPSRSGWHGRSLGAVPAPARGGSSACWSRYWLGRRLPPAPRSEALLRQSQQCLGLCTSPCRRMLGRVTSAQREALRLNPGVRPRKT